MNKKIKKNLARLVIAVLLISTVAAVLPFATENTEAAATPEGEDNYGYISNLNARYDLHYNDEDGDNSWGEGTEPADDWPGAPAGQVTVGEKDVMFEPIFFANTTVDFPTSRQDAINVTLAQVEEVQRLDENVDYEDAESGDWSLDTGVVEWQEDQDTDGSSGGFTGEADIGPFSFNVTEDAEPGIYRVEMEFTLKNYTVADGWYSNDKTQTEYVVFEVENNVLVHDMAVTPGDYEFDSYNLQIENPYDPDPFTGVSGAGWDYYASYWGGGGEWRSWQDDPSHQQLQHVNLTIDESEMQGITIHNPGDTTYLGTVNEGPIYNANYVITVPRDTPTGEYQVPYEVKAKRVTDSGLYDEAAWIMESGTFTLTIEPLPEITATIVEPTSIMQGTTKTNLTVDFENTGNMDLQHLEFNLAPSAYGTSNDYYDEYYNPQAEDEERIVEELPVGETATFTFMIGLDKNIQLGEHEVKFDVDAWNYTYDNGFTQQNSPGQMDYPSDRFSVTENPDYIPLRGGSIGLTNWYNPVRVTDMGYQTITAEIVNEGMVDYTDIEVQLDLSETPFDNPSGTGDMVMMYDQPFTLNAGNTRDVQFGVIIDTTFIEDRLDADNPVYHADLHISALNTDILDTEEKTITTRGMVAGMGPKIMVREPTEENKVKAGKSFELTYTLENIGDEPVRDLQVTILPNVIGAGGTQFVDGQEAVYYQQAVVPPGAYIATVEPSETVLNPGESTTVTFHMKPSSDMQEGAIYYYNLEINGEQETGNYNQQSGTAIRTSEDKSTKPMLSDNITWLLIAVIAGIFFALGMFLLSKKSKAEPAGGEPEPVAEPVQEEPVYEEETVEEEPDWGEEPEEEYVEEEPEPVEEEEEFIGEEEEDEEVW